MSSKTTIVATVISLAALTAGSAAQAFNMGNMMNPSRWFNDNDRYDRYDRNWGGGPYGYGGPYGWGGPYGGYGGSARAGGAVRAQAKEWQARLGARELRVNRDEYLRQIEGLIYGEDPRQGYEAGGIFFHPELRFQFPVPADGS